MMHLQLQGIDYVRTSISSILIGQSSVDEHLNNIAIIRRTLLEAGLKVYKNKVKFFSTEIEHLIFWLNRKCIKPMPNNILAIDEMKSKTKPKDIQPFIGMVMLIRWYKYLTYIIHTSTDTVRFDRYT